MSAAEERARRLATESTEKETTISTIDFTGVTDEEHR
jgi:hypothetical protein